jgi:hypothetical protein
MGEALYQGAIEVLDAALSERFTWFETLADKMGKSVELGEKFLSADRRADILRQQRELREKWPELKNVLTDPPEEDAGRQDRDAFLAKLASVREAQGNDYIGTIRSLDGDAASLGTLWLQRVVDAVVERGLACVPSCRL